MKGVLLDVACRLPAGWHRRPELDGPTGQPAPLVDEAVPGDREHPRPELALAPLEAAQVAHDLEKDLAGHILGIAGAAGANVAEDGRRQVLVDAGPGPISAGPGRLKDR